MNAKKLQIDLGAALSGALVVNGAMLTYGTVYCVWETRNTVLAGRQS